MNKKTIDVGLNTLAALLQGYIDLTEIERKIFDCAYSKYMKLQHKNSEK